MSRRSYQLYYWDKDDAKNVFPQEAEAPILGVALTASLPNLLRVALQVSEACFAIT